MPKHRELLIVTANGEHARFIGLGSEGALHTNAELHSDSAHRRSSDIGSDHPGAAFHTGSSAHHSTAPRHDPHELELTAFARRIAEEINGRTTQNGFSELLLAAPSQTLDAIVAELGPDAWQRLKGRLRKDLVKVPDHLLGPHLRRWVRPASHVS